MIVTPRILTPNVQEAGLRLARDGSATGNLYVFEPGAFDPTEMREGTPVPLRSGTGYHRMMLLPFTMSEGRGTAEPALAWEYRPGAWAVAYGGFGRYAEYTGSAEEPPDLSPEPPAPLVSVADGVTVGSPAAALFPFTLSYLPAGLRPVFLSTFPEAGRLTAAVNLHKGPIDVLFTDSSVQTDLRISGMPGPVPGWAPTGTVAGRPAMANGEGFVVDVGEGYFIEVNGAWAATEADRVIAGVRLADWRTPAAWYPADVAVPVG